LQQQQPEDLIGQKMIASLKKKVMFGEADIIFIVPYKYIFFQSVIAKCAFLAFNL
jgi:hypothetical protein